MAEPVYAIRRRAGLPPAAGRFRERARRTRRALAALLAAAALACELDGREATAPPAPAEAAPAAPAVVTLPAGYPSPLAPLRELVGQYPRDVDLWRREPLAGRLHALLGERFATFVTNTEVQSPLLEEDGILYVTGNKQHGGGTDAAALVVDLRRDAVWVWLMAGGESEALLDRDVEVELPADVRIVLENAEPAPAPPEDDEEPGEHPPHEEPDAPQP
ncbi:MAG: hypothetical protein OZ948_04580 [Deltaproteobacteria bacterium]|nr:hypothetical protein [Deltaproteobacteria bacterium]